MKRARAQCPQCHRVLAVQPPAGGDGSVDVYPRHMAYTSVRPTSRCVWSREIVKNEEYVAVDLAEGAS